MKTSRPALAAILALALGAGAAFAFATFGRAEKAPTVAYTLLDGSRTSTDAWHGKVVMVNFWATDCVPCVQAMPQMVAMHRQYQARGFDTLAVSMRYDPPAYVIRFAETRKLPFGVAIDNTGSIAKAFGDVKVTPTSLLINKRGEVVKRYVGEPDFAALNRLVEALLAQT